MIAKKTWEEFRSRGLLLFINTFLHVFGWTIVLEFDEDKIVNCYPARTKFRGFDETNTSEAYRKLSAYMADNAEQLKKEAYEEEDKEAGNDGLQ